MSAILPIWILLVWSLPFASERVDSLSGPATAVIDTGIRNQAASTTIIESGDVLEIVILGEEGLSRTLMVMRSGNISFPLIGDVHVAGLTSDQATELLAGRLKKYFTHPIISVIFQSPSTPHVSVFGEVLRPGALEYQRGLRLSDYIALAGGPKPGGDLTRVKVIRFDNDKSSAEVVDVAAIIQQGQSETNYILKSGDWLNVPEKRSFNWGAFFQVATLGITLINLFIVLNRQ